MEVIRILALLLILLSTNIAEGQYQLEDPWDPFAQSSTDTTGDQDKSSERLIQEASIAMYDQPLTARSKLLLALKKSPRSVLALTMLGNYYTVNVGHYRLALKYYKKAEQIFFEDHGQPPYQGFQEQLIHAEILRQLSAVRQNLDLYPLALQTLEQYESFGYTDPYLESSKAWILFKLKRIEEGVEVAKQGIRRGSAIGNNLNMLGILYSVQGKEEDAIKTLQKAYDFEKSLGYYARPATPLNNMGEVYREIFDENRAANSWESALRLPDGCEHVLPSLNLAILHMEGLRLPMAKSTLMNFKNCFAQYPLRNNEEHQSLLELAYGRIKYYQGDFAGAIKHYQTAIEHQQWFGSIGTNIEDLQAAIYSDLRKTLIAHNNLLRNLPIPTILQRLATQKEIFVNYLKIKWYERKVQILLLNRLNNFEDLFIRYTDSLLDYPALGFFFESLPLSTAKRLFTQQTAKDLRPNAQLYYQTYLAFNYAVHGNKDDAQKLLLQVLNDPKLKFDLALKAQAMAKLTQLINKPAERQAMAEKLFALLPSMLLSYNLKLAVQTEQLPTDLLGILQTSPLDLGSGLKSQYHLTYSTNDNTHYLTLRGPNKFIKTVQANDYFSLANELVLGIFTEKDNE